MALGDELTGLDPVDLMEQEAVRIVAFAEQLSPTDWEAPTRCEGWSVRDLVAHLDSTEDYFEACLAGTVSPWIQALLDRGATDLAAFNAALIADRTGVPNDQLVATWAARDAVTRDGFRARGDSEVDTSVGMYPARWQAFHLAGELATHADDMHVPVPAADARDRLAWRTRFSRFSLKEAKADLTIEAADGGTRVRGENIDVVLDDDDFVEAVAGRADGRNLEPEVVALLSTMP
jgi:uncharacterized protein (TIGR03083 family)